MAFPFRWIMFHEWSSIFTTMPILYQVIKIILRGNLDIIDAWFPDGVRIFQSEFNDLARLSKLKLCICCQSYIHHPFDPLVPSR